VNFVVAKEFFTDTIATMNMNFTGCSIISVGIGLGTLLLRRQAR